MEEMGRMHNKKISHLTNKESFSTHNFNLIQIFTGVRSWINKVLFKIDGYTHIFKNYVRFLKITLDHLSIGEFYDLELHISTVFNNEEYQGGQHFNFSKFPDFSLTFPEKYPWLWNSRATLKYINRH